MQQSGKNLDQSLIDNPPIKAHGALQIADCVFLGDARTAHDASFLTQNKITHIMNTSGAGRMPNIFDNALLKDPLTVRKLKETNNINSALIGKIKYFTIENWQEHRVDGITDMGYVKEIFMFVEEAV